MILLMARKLHQMLLVLTILNQLSLRFIACIPTNLEFSSAAEFIKVIFGNLSNLEQPRLAIVVNDGTTLDVGLGLVSDLHDVFGLSIHHGLEDVEIDYSTKVVNVGDEDVLLACSDELVKEARVAEAGMRCQL